MIYPPTIAAKGNLMEDLKKTILKSFEEKFNSPLVGYILTSWFLYNWIPIIYFIFGKSENVQERVKIAMDATNQYDLFLFPLVTGVMLTIGLPFLNYLIKKITSKAVTLDEKLTELRTGEIERDKAITLATKAESLQKVEESKMNIESKQILSKTLEGAIAQLESQKKSVEEQILNQEKKLHDIENDIKSSETSQNNWEKTLNDNQITYEECLRLRDLVVDKDYTIQNLNTTIETNKVINKVVMRARKEKDVNILEEANSALETLGYGMPRPI